VQPIRGSEPLDRPACWNDPAFGPAGRSKGDDGRPGYAPGDLLKLYVYGYLNRVRSSRRPKWESRRNIEVIWLVRGLKPDFKAIADFRRDNRGAGVAYLKFSQQPASGSCIS
jgi:transposase